MTLTSETEFRKRAASFASRHQLAMTPGDLRRVARDMRTLGTDGALRRAFYDAGHRDLKRGPDPTWTSAYAAHPEWGRAA